MLTEDEARERYTTERDGFAILPDIPGIGEGNVVTPWAVQAQVGSRTFQSFFFNPAGSIIRILGWYYDNPPRLFRGDVLDYTYPDDHERYLQSDASVLHSLRVRPDGTARVEVNDRSLRDITRMRYQSVPIDSYWLDRPEFGDWESLHDPEYGDHDLDTHGRSAE